ncbi:MAG: class I SAM-dependent methyltransferase [Acidimicrobiales bacterium]|nr:class I SAM-dependent methyltransferase [Acidimicrobiales bacterium]
MTVLAALDEHILPLVPGLVDRRERGLRVLDVGCGRGLALLQLAERFPRSHFVGYDLSHEAVDFARERSSPGSPAPSPRAASTWPRTSTPRATSTTTPTTPWARSCTPSPASTA